MTHPLIAALRRGILGLAVAAALAGPSVTTTARAGSEAASTGPGLSSANPRPGVWRDADGRIYLIARVGSHYRLAVLVSIDERPQWFSTECPAPWRATCSAALWFYGIRTTQQGDRYYAPLENAVPIDIYFTGELEGWVRYPATTPDTGGSNHGFRHLSPAEVTLQPPEPGAVGTGWWQDWGTGWEPTRYFVVAPTNARDDNPSTDQVEIYSLGVAENGRRYWTMSWGQMIRGTATFHGLSAAPVGGDNFPFPARKAPEFALMSATSTANFSDEIGLVVDVGAIGGVRALIGPER